MSSPPKKLLASEKNAKIDSREGPWDLPEKLLKLVEFIG